MPNPVNNMSLAWGYIIELNLHAKYVKIEIDESWTIINKLVMERQKPEKDNITNTRTEKALGMAAIAALIAISGGG